MTTKEKILLENRIYNILKENFFGGDDGFYEEEESSSDNDSSTDDDDDIDHSVDVNGIKVIVSSDNKQVSDRLKGLVSRIIPALEGTNDNSVNSFNLTRSQLAYELWPDIDKDSARSKLSQKVQGDKAWQEWEINKMANIISGNVN